MGGGDAYCYICRQALMRTPNADYLERTGSDTWACGSWAAAPALNPRS
jgi:hypothetical protein